MVGFDTGSTINGIFLKKGRDAVEGHTTSGEIEKQAWGGEKGEMGTHHQF